MAINKVIYGGDTLIDLTDSTVTADTLAAGAVAYDAAGERIVGEKMDKIEIINGTWDGTNILTVEKTAAEMVALKEEGKHLILCMFNGDNMSVFQLNGYSVYPTFEALSWINSVMANQKTFNIYHYFNGNPDLITSITVRKIFIGETVDELPASPDANTVYFIKE